MQKLLEKRYSILSALAAIVLGLGFVFQQYIEVSPTEYDDRNTAVKRLIYGKINPIYVRPDIGPQEKVAAVIREYMIITGQLKAYLSMYSPDTPDTLAKKLNDLEKIVTDEIDREIIAQTAGQLSPQELQKINVQPATPQLMNPQSISDPQLQEARDNDIPQQNAPAAAPMGQAVPGVPGQQMAPGQVPMMPQAGMVMQQAQPMMMPQAQMPGQPMMPQGAPAMAPQMMPMAPGQVAQPGVPTP